MAVRPDTGEPVGIAAKIVYTGTDPRAAFAVAQNGILIYRATAKPALRFHFNR